VGLIDGPSPTLTVVLFCRGDAEQLDTSLRGIAAASEAVDLWLEVQLVPWQLTPSGLERATAAMAAHSSASNAATGSDWWA
jgi:hypothetical protein